MASPTAPVSPARRCPGCNAPTSDRAIVCAFCDHVFDPAAFAVPVAKAPRRASAPRVEIGRMLLKVASRALVLVAFLSLVVGGLGALFVRSVQQRIVRRVARMAAEYEAAGARTAWSALDSAIAVARAGAGAGSVVDERAAAQVASFGRRGRVDDAFIREAPETLPPPARAATPASVRLAAFAALPARPARSTLDSLAGDTLDARLAAWRALARSAPLPALWPYSSKVTELRDPYALPELPFAGTKELAGRNASAALVALAAGDTAAAVRRLRENVAAAGQLVRVPSILNLIVGRAIVAEAGTLLGHLARAAADSALAREAATIDRLTSGRAAPLRVLQAAPAWFGDPDDPRGPALVGDRTLSPAQRVGLLGAVVGGSCMRTREVLFGISPRRRETLRRAGAQLADIEGVAPAIAMHERWLDDMIERPRETLRAMGRRAGAPLPRRATMPLIGGTSARFVTCMRML